MLERLKWAATGTLIVGFGLTSAGFIEGVFIQLTGGILWLTAALWMRDRPLIATNALMTLVGIIGLTSRFW
jgi:hypothetical protein